MKNNKYIINYLIKKNIISVKSGVALLQDYQNIHVGEMVQGFNPMNLNIIGNGCGCIIYTKGLKSYLKLSKKTSHATYFIVKRGMRKAAGNTILNIPQKQGISSYLYGFINNVIDKTTKREELLPNLVEYFKDNTLGELVLKQTIAKGFFPTFTFRKKEVLPLVDSSNKLTLVNPMEKADVRFFSEAIIANKFAEQQENIQKISFNSEKPSEVVVKSSYGGGNYVKDVTLTVKPLLTDMELDIKIGNNAYQTNNNILGPVPLLADDSVYMVLCDKVIGFNIINGKRIEKFGEIIKKDPSLKNNAEIIFEFSKLKISPLQKNILIQDELLKMISAGLLKQNPSFYSGFKVIRHEVEVNFYKKMEPFININNFNSKRDFEVFARYGLKAFYESVKEANRSLIFDKNLFKETGFDQIDLENLFEL